MTEPVDLIVGAVLMDNIIYADGTRRENVPGGAGLYALAGAALFSPNALLVTGTGRDLPETFGPWMERNGLSTAALRFADDHAPRNILKYIDEATRTEIPVYGFAHFARIEPSPADVEASIGGARSMYVFRNTDERFWTGLLPLIETHRPKVLWEIGLDACTPQELPNIRNIAASIDALSINLEEAALILGTTSEPALIEALKTLGAPLVLLRAGSRGSYAITAAETVFVPAPAIEPVDVTGGGNAFGGGATIGLAEGQPPRRVAAMGAAAARFAISQYGPPEPAEVRLRARALVAELMQSTEQHV
jgi:sugar/nucleoside kinase (ribokinase family)